MMWIERTLEYFYFFDGTFMQLSVWSMRKIVDRSPCGINQNSACDVQICSNKFQVDRGRSKSVVNSKFHN